MTGDPKLVFEARELKPYAEPIAPEELKLGGIYFSVQYADDEMLVPQVGTWVFVGWDSIPDQGRIAILQTIDSHREGVQFDEASNEDKRSGFICQPEDQLKFIFDFEHALDALMSCSIRRRRLKAES